ncbi:antitoxin [Alkalilimnicola ehrlichii]|uniref:Antitoxin n=2 Tax=Alkalilimnicola ehrlichii TaxID=351052 RepID=A0A3E0WX14_9GAMM|nr:antitoxin [Alkalilimnicola ehrlichii]RFA36556.1 antitoxin [Alkalilimnicola ehrlichii]
MHEAKSKLSQLAEKVYQGERVVIAKAGKPYLELLPLRDGRRQRTPGRLAGKITMAPDFDATPDEVIRAFEGQE